MQHAQIEISDQPNPDAERILSSGLAAFNEQAAGYHDRRPLTVLIRDPHTQEVLGGITGRTAFGMAFLDLFHLPDSLRGTGLGSQLIRAFARQLEAGTEIAEAADSYTLRLHFQAAPFASEPQPAVSG